ncbi:MAG: protein kinase domain-containing protein, partial [Roseiflexaceae bacterium]
EPTMSIAPALCPVCGTNTTPHNTACGNCGLIFASYAPAGGAGAPPAPALPPLICPHCGQPTPAGSSTCGACGAALTYTYQALFPGQTLTSARYTVQRALSKGGMGAIYLATDHEVFDRSVIIKAMLDYFDPADPHAVQVARERFLQEAKTLSTLRHPTIPQIYTYFQDGPYNYIVMEYIEGHDLEQHLTHDDDATGNEKNQVILLWSTRDGALLGKLPVYQGPITSVAFAPDGRTLFSTNAGGTMMVWRTP